MADDTLVVQEEQQAPVLDQQPPDAVPTEQPTEIKESNEEAVPTPAPAPAPAPAAAAPEEESLYMIKRIHYKGSRIGVITQNENGPCPLIALTNILLLKQVISIHEDRACVTFSDLVQMVTDALKERFTLRGLDSDPNAQYALSEAVSLLPSLEKGMDINIKYSGFQACEFGTGVACFDAFGIKLVHGWLPSPDDEYYSTVKDQSYNGLVELIINKNDEQAKPQDEQNPDTIQKGVVAEAFMNETASQLTYEGLFSLTQGLTEGELCVFFRNNHFSTITKHESRLFVLLTDIGYRDVPEAIWESLSEVGGDMFIAGYDFQRPRDFGRQAGVLQAASGQQQQQQQQQQQHQDGGRMTQEDTDRLLALQLMEQDEAALAQQRQQRPPQQQQQQQRQQHHPQRQYNSRHEYNQRQNRLADQAAQEQARRRELQNAHSRPQQNVRPQQQQQQQQQQRPIPQQKNKKDKKKSDCVIS